HRQGPRGPAAASAELRGSAHRRGGRVRAGAAVSRLFEWLQARTGYRGALEVMLDEPLPPGTSWFFTLGSVLLTLLSVQFLTGAVLTLYYAPTPDHAYDSVKFITEHAAGGLVRGLHHHGATFLVVAMVAHTLRVIV